MSLVGLVVAPGAILIAATDYRGTSALDASSFGIEDLIFSFALFGIAAVIYGVLLGKRAHALRGKRHRISSPTLHWGSKLTVISGIWLFTTLILLAELGVDPIQAFVISGVFIGIYIIADRKDLLYNALLSAVFIAVLVFLVEQIFFVRLYPDAIFWSQEVTNGLLLAGIPIQEILWAAVVGFAVGPLYEYVRDLELR